MRRPPLRFIVVSMLALLAGVGVAVAVAAGGGGTATTIGQATGTVETTVSGGDRVAVQALDDPSRTTYRVPAGGGILTGWRVRIFSAFVSGEIRLKVLRSLGGDLFRVEGQDSEAVATSGVTEQDLTFTARIPVTGGETLGIYLPNDISVGALTGVSGPPGGRVDFGSTGDVAPTGTVTANAGSSGNNAMQIQAVIEPDADRDGFGDLSQDQCPGDAARQANCVTDLAIAASASPATVRVGEVAAIASTVTARAGDAAGVSLTQSIPAGLELVSAVSSAGSCTPAATLTCALGTLPAGGSALVVAVVRARAVGTPASAVSVGAATSEVNPADNAATAILRVGAPSVSRGCVVPPVTGLTRAKASKLLLTFGCTTGKVTTRKPAKGARGRTAVVIRSSPKAGTRLADRAKVALTLRRPKRR